MKEENHGNCLRCKNSLFGLRVDARYCGKRCRILSTKKRIKIRAGLFVTGIVRNCLECNDEFSPKYDRNTYCSKKCSKVAYQKKIGGVKNRNCEICSKEFTPNSSMHWLCSKECKKAKTRQIMLAKSYGISPEQFSELLKNQGGCAICQTQNAYRWAVDHDHSCCSGGITCGKCVRGILCFPCNQALGMFKDSQNILQRALEYILQNKKNNS